MEKINFSIPTDAFVFVRNWWLTEGSRTMSDIGQRSAMKAEHYKPLVGIGAYWMLFPRWGGAKECPLLMVSAECSEKEGILSGVIEVDANGYEKDIVALIDDLLWGVQSTDSDISPLLPLLETGRRMAEDLLVGYNRNSSFLGFYGCSMHEQDAEDFAQLRNRLAVFESWLEVCGQLSPDETGVFYSASVTGRISSRQPLKVQQFPLRTPEGQRIRKAFADPFS